MTAEDIIRLRKKVEAKKEERIKAQTTVDNIMKEWKEKHGIETVEQAQAKVDELKQEIEKTNKQIETVSDKLEELTDWEE